MLRAKDGRSFAISCTALPTIAGWVEGRRATITKWLEQRKNRIEPGCCIPPTGTSP
jgi:hypothetical protein